MPEPQRWDEHGTPIGAQAGATRWDEHGNPIGAPAAKTKPKVAPAKTEATPSLEQQAFASPPVPKVPLPGELGPPRTTGERIGREFHEASDEIGDVLRGGVEGAVKLLDPRSAGMSRLHEFFIDPAKQQFAAGKAAPSKVEAGGHYLAGMLPIVGPFAAQAGERLGAGQWGRGAVDVAAALGPGGSKLLRDVSDAARVIERHPTVEQGKIGLVNTARNAISRLENEVRGPSGEVGRHAQAVIAADKLDLAKRGSPGAVSGIEATNAGQAVLDKLAGGGVADGFKTQMGMDEAKAIISKLGSTAARLERAGRAPEASVLWAEYDALRKATQERATALGADFGKSWQHYIGEFHNWMQLQKGVVGHVMEGEHTAALDQLIKHEGQLPEVYDWFKKYKIDPAPLTEALEQGKKIAELTQQSKNMFFGKIRAIARHKWTAGPAAIAAAYVGHATGIPVLGFVLPLLVAGRVAGLVDAFELRGLLKDIAKRVGPEAMRVAPTPEGPRPLPPPPEAGGAAPGPGSPLAQPSVPGGESEIESRIRGAAGQPPLTQEQINDLVQQKHERGLKREAEKSLSRGELASKLQGARKAKEEHAADMMSTNKQDRQSALKGRRLREYFEKKNKASKK